MTVQFHIMGEPVGKGRPRFARCGGYVKTYTPDKTVSYEKLVQLEYIRQVKNCYFESGVQLMLDIKAYFAIPKSTSKKRRALMAEGKIRPTKKPDIDNIFKIIADSLNTVAYHDDSQIISGMVTKLYSEQPRVEVAITEMEG